MISLGIGELVSSSSFILRTFFGGEEGITTNRSALAPFFGHKFGPQIEVYYLIAAWCFFSIVAMYALTRTPFGRMCNAVRDNPERVEFVGYSPRVLRMIAFCFAAFFAGIAGGLDGDQFRNHELGATRRGTIEPRAVHGLYRRGQFIHRADRRRGDRHLPADHLVRRFERLAALFRPDVHRRRALRAGRRRRLGQAAPAGGAARAAVAARALLRPGGAGVRRGLRRRDHADRIGQPAVPAGAKRGLGDASVRRQPRRCDRAALDCRSPAVRRRRRRGSAALAAQSATPGAP